MPELPEVQTVVNDLRKADIFDISITKADVFWDKSVAGMTSNRFCRKMAGERFSSISRRGKYIHLTLASHASLFIHLRMSGRIYVVDTETARSKHEHIIITFKFGLSV